MSGFGQLMDLACVAQLHCPTYKSSWFSDYFIAQDYWPVYLFIILAALRWYTGELYIECLNDGMALNYALNLALQYGIKQPPPVVGCGAQYEMPSFSSQNLAFFVVMVMLAMIQWARTVQWERAAVLAMSVVLIVYGRVHIGYNTPEQLFAGGGFGVLFGILAHWVVVLFVAPYGDLIVERMPRRYGITTNAVMREYGETPVD